MSVHMILNVTDMANIGTIFTKFGKKALLCGSGELGKEVAIELQRYGVQVVAVDKYEMLLPCRWPIHSMSFPCSTERR